MERVRLAMDPTRINANRAVSYQYLDSTTGKCVNTCPIGYYADPLSNTCKHCYQAASPSSTYQNCYTCKAGTYTDCTDCLSGIFLYQEDQTCLITCPNGWWGDLPSRTCKICYQYTASSPTLFTCATCSGGNSNNCLTCSSPYFFDSTTGTCVQTCPTAYYGDSSSNICKLAIVVSQVLILALPALAPQPMNASPVVLDIFMRGNASAHVPQATGQTCQPTAASFVIQVLQALLAVLLVMRKPQTAVSRATPQPSYIQMLLDSV